MAKVSIHFTALPYGKCPVQAEGEIDGHTFYFRSRGAHWALHIAPKGKSPFDSKAWVHVEEYRGRRVYLDEKAADGQWLAAGYADDDECIAFIEKAAALWGKRRKRPRKRKT